MAKEHKGKVFKCDDCGKLYSYSSPVLPFKCNLVVINVEKTFVYYAEYLHHHKKKIHDQTKYTRDQCDKVPEVRQVKIHISKELTV